MCVCMYVYIFICIATFIYTHVCIYSIVLALALIRANKTYFGPFCDPRHRTQYTAFTFFLVLWFKYGSFETVAVRLEFCCRLSRPASTCMQMYTYIYFACIDMCKYTYIHICKIYIYVYTCQLRKCIYAYRHIYIYAEVQIFRYTDLHMHIHMHIYRCTYTRQ